MKTDIESGIESPEISPLVYGQMSFDKSAKTKTVFSTNNLEKLDSHMQKVRLDSYTINKNFSKWIDPPQGAPSSGCSQGLVWGKTHAETWWHFTWEWSWRWINQVSDVSACLTTRQSWRKAERVSAWEERDAECRLMSAARPAFSF